MVGLGWITAGLGSRSDIRVVTVEGDAARSSAAQQAGSWPTWVSFVVGDAIEVVPELGTFDLLFADAEGGKCYGLDETIAAVGPRGLLVLDDLQPQTWKTGDERTQTLHLAKMQEMRATVTRRPDLLSVELDNGAGVLLAVRI